jgi:hypothetical protein
VSLVRPWPWRSAAKHSDWVKKYVCCIVIIGCTETLYFIRGYFGGQGNLTLRKFPCKILRRGLSCLFSLKVLYRISLERLMKITGNSSTFPRKSKPTTTFSHVYGLTFALARSNRSLEDRINYKRQMKPCTSLLKASGFQEFKAPTFPDSRRMKVVKLSDPHTECLYPAIKYSWYSFLVKAESISGYQWKIPNYNIGNRTRDLPALSQYTKPLSHRQTHSIASDNTHHSQNRDIHYSGDFQTNNPSKPTAKDTRFSLRLLCVWGWR